MVSILILSVALVASIIILAKGSDIFTDAAKELSHILGITYTVVGILIVSISTTLPENTVSIYSAATGAPQVAFGNGVGSIIFNVGVAVAIGSILKKGNKLDSHVYMEDIPVMMGLTLLAWVFSYINSDISRLEGTILLILGIVYYVLRFRRSKSRENAKRSDNLPKMILLLLTGLLMVVLGSVGLKESGVRIAKELGVPEIYISIVLIAVGTSIPELATAVASALKGVGEISVGNVIGANIIDVSIAVGLAAVICPIPIDPQSLSLTFPFTLAIFLIFEIGVLIRKRMDWTVGLPLLLVYYGYVYVLYLSYTS
ncbi:MAG TPA: sodium:calcium antiporter [Euryarchaeota archaeon]|nr:sodium:calcium antiporter [Euryarchaeota archaeon]